MLAVPVCGVRRPRAGRAETLQPTADGLIRRRRLRIWSSVRIALPLWELPILIWICAGCASRTWRRGGGGAGHRWSRPPPGRPRARVTSDPSGHRAETGGVHGCRGAGWRLAGFVRQEPSPSVEAVDRRRGRIRSGHGTEVRWATGGGLSTAAPTAGGPPAAEWRVF